MGLAPEEQDGRRSAPCGEAHMAPVPASGSGPTAKVTAARRGADRHHPQSPNEHARPVRYDIPEPIAKKA